MSKPAHRAADAPHAKLVALEHQCARLKQQKRVAEKFASEAHSDAQATKQLAARFEAQLQDSQRRARHYEELARLRAVQLDEVQRRVQYYEGLAESRLAEVYRLRQRADVSFQARVEHEVFRIVEATGNPTIFPAGLAPNLAAVQSKVGAAALQRRENRINGKSSLQLHPSVHEWGSFCAREHVTCCTLDV